MPQHSCLHRFVLSNSVGNHCLSQSYFTTCPAEAGSAPICSRQPVPSGDEPGKSYAELSPNAEVGRNGAHACMFLHHSLNIDVTKISADFSPSETFSAIRMSFVDRDAAREMLLGRCCSCAALPKSSSTLAGRTDIQRLSQSGRQHFHIGCTGPRKKASVHTGYPFERTSDVTRRLFLGINGGLPAPNPSPKLARTGRISFYRHCQGE